MTYYLKLQSKEYSEIKRYTSKGHFLYYAWLYARMQKGHIMIFPSKHIWTERTKMHDCFDKH